MTDVRTHSGKYVMAPMVTHLLDLLAWNGQSATKVLERAGVGRDELAPASGRLPVEIAARVLHAALEESGDAQLALRLSAVTFTNGFGVIGYVAQSSPKLKESIDAAIRFGPLMSNAGFATLDHEPGQALWTLTVEHDDAVLRRQATEFLLGVGYRFLLLVDAKRSEIVREVRFVHEAPRNADQLAVYAEVFHCPVRFGAPKNALVLNAAALALPLRQPDATLRDVVEQQAERKLSELSAGEADFRARVRAEIERLVQRGEASRETLAERLGVSGRHLARQLANAGLGYRELVDEVRMEIARDQLRNSQRTLAEIGDQLGFADGQSFIRWFRGAAGMTPGEFRQRSG